MTDCVFCFKNSPNLDVVKTYDQVLVIRPLDPVAEGHVLVIDPRYHTSSAADDPSIAANLMYLAASYVRDEGIQANIITSIGPAATQTVKHTHVHVVPREANDDLPLPWTPQQMALERFRRALEANRPGV